MAGHSQFKNIMRRKGAQDAKKGQIFTKLGREIIVAARTGMPDPAFNPRLRAAIITARAANMTRDRIENAIKKGSGALMGENYEEIRYEGYGPGGVAIIIEALTDNRNRTAPEMRAAFTKYGGNLAETGSVSFGFHHVGLMHYPLATATEDAMLEAALEAGADNCEQVDEGYDVTTALADFAAVREALTTRFGDPQKAKLVWVPQTMMPVDEETAIKAVKLLELLEDNEDVQEVYSNLEMSDELAERLSA
jgi:YebC/PmpR family DNA-binding regulatory protein